MQAYIPQPSPRLHEDAEEGCVAGDQPRRDARASAAEGCCGYMLQALRNAGYGQAGQRGVHIASCSVGAAVAIGIYQGQPG
jgi:uncharacterized membrane protein YjjB (DUF3815 family)